MLKFYAENSVIRRGLIVGIAKRIYPNENYIARIEWDELPSDFLTIPPENELVLDEDEARNLINALWKAGVRPSKDIQDPVNHTHLIEEIHWNRNLIEKLLNKLIT